METSNVTIAVIAALGSLGSTVGLEIIRRWLTRSKEKSDVATTIRAELRTEIAGLKKEIDDLEREVDSWKKKYWDLREEYLDKREQLEREIKEAHAMPTTLLKGDHHGNSN